MNMIIYKGFLLIGVKRVTKQIRQSVKYLVNFFWLDKNKKLVPRNVIDRKVQISYNHQHFGSSKKACQYIDEVYKSFFRKFPKSDYDLVVDWRQGKNRERGNKVTVSFYLEKK